MDFEARLHLVCQKRLPQRHNTGYPPLVVYYHRHPPVVMTAAGVPEVPFRADPRLLDAARKLGPLADFLVIPSNATHNFRADIERAAGREVLSIIDVTLADVRRHYGPAASTASSPAVRRFRCCSANPRTTRTW